MEHFVIAVFALISFCGANIQNEEIYELNIIHYNDFHARFDEINPWSGICDPKSAPCIGGFARLATAVKDALHKEPESLLFNAGDSFQGSIWYNLLRWNVTQEFMNLLPHDAFALGNHEFDSGLDGVIPYIKHLNAVTLVSNIVDDLEPSFQGLTKKSEIFIRNNRRIGVIGVLIKNTQELASVGKLQLTDEIEAVRKEAEILNSQGVDIIIVLSHCGIEVETEMARLGGPYIDMIVGAHSHSLLYNGKPPGQRRAQGSYPMVVMQDDGRQVLLVQAAAFTEYLGEIKLFFDSNGDILKWSGNPRYLGEDVPQDPEVLSRLEVYKGAIEQMSEKPIGETRVLLSNDCSCGECNFGDLICDAFLYSVLDKAQEGHWQYAHACLINQGAIRVSISPGNITFGSMLMSMPFENMVEAFDLRGDHLVQVLEYALSHKRHVGAHMVQVSGMHVDFDNSAPLGHRVRNVFVRCIDCPIPEYHPLRNDTYYKIVAPSYIGHGGDGFTAISDNRINVEPVTVDYEAIRKYFERQSPIIQGLENRIHVRQPCVSNKSNSHW